jgi:hypothetical protein
MSPDNCAHTMGACGGWGGGGDGGMHQHVANWRRGEAVESVPTAAKMASSFSSEAWSGVSNLENLNLVPKGSFIS